MNKYDTYLDSNENNDIIDIQDTMDNDEIIYISPEEFKQNQLDEQFELFSNFYDFIKNYMESKEYIFPILDNHSFKSFSNFLNNYIKSHEIDK